MHLGRTGWSPKGPPLQTILKCTHRSSSLILLFDLSASFICKQETTWAWAVKIKKKNRVLILQQELFFFFMFKVRIHDYKWTWRLFFKVTGYLHRCTNNARHSLPANPQEHHTLQSGPGDDCVMLDISSVRFYKQVHRCNFGSSCTSGPETLGSSGTGGVGRAELRWRLTSTL